MAWTNPTQRGNGDTITASILNTDIVDNLAHLGGIKINYDPSDGSTRTLSELATGEAIISTIRQNIIAVAGGAQSDTNFSTLVADANGGRLVSSGAQNDEITYALALSKGTWTFELNHTKTSSCGIYSVYVGGTLVGTIDGYAAVPAFNARDTIAGITISENGFYEVELRMASKNASSANYTGLFHAFSLVKTGS